MDKEKTMPPRRKNGLGKRLKEVVKTVAHKVTQKSRSKKAIARLNWDRKGNPAEGASDLFEEFHGVPSEEVLEFVTQFHVHENLAGLGQLVEMTFITQGVKPFKVTLTEEDLGAQAAQVWLCSSEDAKSLYVIGTVEIDLEKLGYRPEVDVKDSVELGRLTDVVYRTRKAMHKLKLTDYDHKIGKREAWQKRDGVGPEINKDVAACPVLIYNTREDRLLIAGGQYIVMDIGISN